MAAFIWGRLLSSSLTSYFISHSVFNVGFCGGSVIKNPSANGGMWVQSLGGEDPLEKEMATHSSILFCLFVLFFCFCFFNFIFKLYIIVLVLPNIKMNPPQVYMCSPSWTLLPPPSPFHPSTLQYSCLTNAMDRGAWWAIIHSISKESKTALLLNNNI